MTPTEITRSDILPPDVYAAERAERRRAITAAKKDRRVHVGPDSTFYFENYDTMFHQIHEMLHIEKGGEEQIEDELRAYNPLIPKGNELVATFMIEVDDPLRRDRLLSQLGGIERTITLSFGDHTVQAEPEGDVERTSADGKASSVHFFHFPFTAPQKAAFKTPGTKVLLGINHAAYGHLAALAEATREALAADLS
ncbi:MAG: DUF3501 family protein [Rhodospirillales bacterium]